MLVLPLWRINFFIKRICIALKADSHKALRSQLQDQTEDQFTSNNNNNNNNNNNKPTISNAQ